MYMMFLQGSPCEKSVSFLPNSIIVLATPVEVRKASASNVLGFLFPIARLLFFITFTSCYCVHPGGRRCAACSIVGSAGKLVVFSSALGAWVLGANMRRMLFVALAFVVLLHFVQITAKRRT